MKHILSLITGNTTSFSLQHRILNITEFFGGIIFFQATIVNYFLGLPLVVNMITLMATGIMLSLFYLSRIRHLYRIPVLFSLSLIIVIIGPTLWITNGGLDGSIPYWYVYTVVVASILTRGIEKKLLIAMSLLAVASLSMVEFYQLVDVFTYENQRVRMLDLIPQIILVMIVLLSLVTVIINSYRQEHINAVQYSERLMQANEEMQRIINTDFLTGLFNRSYILDKMEYEKTRTMRTGIPFGVMIADIDNFKSINDTYGHNYGDFILKSVASDIRSALRNNDTPARWGGEEFLVLLPDTPLEKTLIVAEKIRKKISERIYSSDNIDYNVTISIGVAIYDNSSGNERIDQIIKRADDALYQSKGSGKNRVSTIDT